MTSRHKLKFQNITGSVCNRVFRTNYSGLLYRNLSQPMVELDSGFNIIHLANPKIIEQKLNEKTGKNFKCGSIQESFKKAQLYCIYEQTTTNEIWINQNESEILEIQETNKENSFVYFYQKIVEGASKQSLNLCTKPDSKYKSKIMSEYRDLSNHILTERIQCDKVKFKKDFWQDDTRFFKVERENSAKTYLLHLYGLIAISPLANCFFSDFEIFHYQYYSICKSCHVFVRL